MGVYDDHIDELNQAIEQELAGATGRERAGLLKDAERAREELRQHDRDLGDLQAAEEAAGSLSPEQRAASEEDDDEDAGGDDGKSLAERETAWDKLNKGYTGDGSKKTRMSKRAHSWFSTRRKWAVAGAFAGTAGVSTFALFLVLLPAKIAHIMANVEAKAFAATADATEKGVERAVSTYMVKYVMPALSDTCRSTVSLSCKATPDNCAGKAFCTLWNAWADNRLEYKLATEHGIVIGKEGNTFYISTPETRASPDDRERVKISPEQYHELQTGTKSIFELPGMRQSTRSEIRAAIREATKSMTLYQRFKVGKLLEKKYGIKRCLIACDVRDKIADSVDAKKLAAKAFLLQRLLPEKYALVLTCVISGASGSCDPTKLDPATSGETTRLSPFEKNLQQRMVALAEQFDIPFKELVAGMQKEAQNISKLGLKRVLAEKAVAKIVGMVGGDAAGAAAGKLASKAFGPIGWVFLGATVVAGAATLGPLLSHAAYATNAATYAQTYATYNTEWAECKSGHCDMTVLGSFMTSLDTSISGDPTKSNGFSHSKLWQYTSGTNSSNSLTASILGSSLWGVAFADGSSADTLCADGKPIPADQLVCPEQNLRNSGNKAATAVSNTVNSIPGLSQTASWLQSIGAAPSELLGSVVEHIPGVSAATEWVGEQATEPMAWVTDQLIVTPDIDSGAQQVDAIIGGADVVANASCQEQLGCAAISDATAASIRNQYLADQRTEFEQRHMFARMFSTDTPYSLISQVAVAMPASLTGIATSGLGSLLTNPFGKLAGVFSSLFTVKSAFADVAHPDPFGIQQYGYMDSQIPRDPEAFWEANCVSGPMGRYSAATGKLDVSQWLNDPNNVSMDETTGQAIYKRPNTCLLLQTTIQVGGGMFDTSLLPPGSATADQTGTGTGDEQDVEQPGTSTSDATNE